jgi:hypothetical protein
LIATTVQAPKVLPTESEAKLDGFVIVGAAPVVIALRIK